MKNENSSEVEYEIFTQDGFLIKKNEASEINLPLFFYNDYRHSAGVKSVFLIEDERYIIPKGMLKNGGKAPASKI